jgi:ClpP class serine protease
MVDDINTAFKEYVVQCRPFLLNTVEIGTDDTWLGSRAYTIGLIDCIITSDEYIHELIYCDNAWVAKLVQVIHSKYPVFSKPTKSSSLSYNNDIISNIYFLQLCIIINNNNNNIHGLIYPNHYQKQQ